MKSATKNKKPQDFEAIVNFQNAQTSETKSHHLRILKSINCYYNFDLHQFITETYSQISM